MSERMNWFVLLMACGCVLGAGAAEVAKPGNSKIICGGRIEPVNGEVELSAEMSGTLTAVLVMEGDWVTNGTVLAEVDARREKAAVDLAVAKLARVKAGNGKEEIAAAEANREAVAAELDLAEAEYQRAIKLRKESVLAEDELDRRRQQAAALRKQVAKADKQTEALKRGPLPEDVALAEAEAGAARTAYELRLVRAVSDGTVLQLYRHAGDVVSVNFPSAILRMANTRRLRARVEVNEQDVYRLKEGMEGEFTTFGASKAGGRLVVKTVLPSFAPRRLFEPDSTARMDTRTLQVLAEVLGDGTVYSGQRMTVAFVCE